MENELLTIGTVVLLKNANHALMVIGFFPQAKEGDDKKVYDYLACHFPEGLEDTTKPLVFNEEEIDKILYIPYSDEDDKKFREKLNQDKEKLLNFMEAKK